ncbi:MAG: glucosyltransferase domain-containing protein [Lachnospiraceae bacterium]|nr:glucosyltransferase domain-containing protein [Lachnospiraceae bacterium]
MTHFVEYCKKNKYLWIVIGGFICLCYWELLMNFSTGIDMEDIINLQGEFYNGWIYTGRPGLVVLKKIMNTYWFNPYLAGILSMMFMLLSCVVWLYLFFCITGKHNYIASLLFSLVLVSSPICVEQYFFRFQTLEIIIGFCLLGIGLVYTYRYVTKNKLPFAFVAVLFNIFVFSFYQSMVAVCLFGAVVSIFLYCFFNDNKEKNLVLITTKYIFIFLISFVVNQILTKLFFSGSSYLSNQINWGKIPFETCIEIILKHIKRVFRGESIFYTKGYIVLLVVFLFVVCARVKKSTYWERIIGILSVILLILAPFYMTFICANEPVMRSQFVYPYILAFFSYILLQFFENKKVIFYALTLVCSIVCYMQVCDMFRLIYTEDVRYQSDIRIASGLINDIDKLQNRDGSIPVVFIGSRQAELNNSCIRGETIGYSFFEWDSNVEPYGYYSTRRIIGFMHSMGVDYKQASMEDTQNALEYSVTMSEWPQEGSVQLYNNIIVIKLSEIYTKKLHDEKAKYEGYVYESDYEGTGIKTTISDANTKMNIEVKSIYNYKQLWIAVWSDENGQDDLRWYIAEKRDDIWYGEIDLTEHQSELGYSIHVYEGEKKPENMITYDKVGGL